MDCRFDFIGEINDSNIILLRNYICNTPKMTKLTINISSLGGSVSAGITAYNFLKQQKFPIATHNLGDVSSSALLLYLAGSVRTAEEVSKFMFHPISLGINGDFPYYKVREFLNNIDADIKNFALIANKETNNFNGLYDVENLLKNDSLTLTRTQAHECGVITAI